MRLAAGILMIISGIIMLDWLDCSTVETYEELDKVLAVIWHIAWSGFVLAGGILTLQRKLWGLCLAASILSVGILPTIFICLRKREWTVPNKANQQRNPTETH